MRFPPQFLDELKARLPVSEVVGRRVKLVRAGREWKGLSPFNKEKTPSFFVNDQKQAWFDFSAQKNGSIFDFVMETEGVTFPEAVERLAQMAGLPLPKPSREEEADAARRKTLFEVMELAAKFFEATLASRLGARARGYLADRGLDPAIQLRFRLGYAPNERFALKEHLGNQGVTVEDMVEAGLLVTGDGVALPYDRFRDRVMFPITDLRNRIIAFGGRALDKDASAKYINSPETSLFRKGATLYNIAAARQAAHQGATVVAVEGYIDVIAMVDAGFPATVAPLGTALTEDQLALIWKMADEPVLCFDGDAAGLRAAYRAADLALSRLAPGKSLKFAALPPGQDPDDLVRAGGREAAADLIGAARPLADLLWARETEGRSFGTPEQRAALEARLNSIVANIADETVRRYYRQEFSARLARYFAPLVTARDGRLRRDRRGGPRQGGSWPTVAGASYVVVSEQLTASPLYRGRGAVPRREALILKAALNHPWLLHDHLEELASLEFRHAEAERLKSALIDIAAHVEAADSADVRAELAARGLGEVVARIEAAITTASVWGAGPGAAPEDVLVTWNQLIGLHRQWHSLIKELKAAEQALGQDSSESNYLRLVDVKARLERMEGTEALIEGFGASSGRGTRGP
ncbi:MAG: DNA primase [Pseudolabrys sp.]|nr:DNA primase [Pseudolabrys sp.]